MKERHALEEQEQQLERKREQLHLEAKMAATLKKQSNISTMCTTIRKVEEIHTKFKVK